MTNRQIAWLLGGLLLGAVLWIVLRSIAYIHGHNHAILTPTAFVLIGGLLGWIAPRILRIK
jgi:hypothetical protein